jgi:serine/threonine protein kinase/formylglycine-generating enzyme required for sulfatase activity
MLCRTTPNGSAAMIEPGQRFDKYTVVRKLGEGGMSMVYEAVNPFGVNVVLKMLHPDLVGQSEVVERFRREGRIQFTLRHPNIVRVTDMVEHDGIPALVVDYMQGTDLEQALKDGHRFDFPDILKITTKMLDALHTAHAAGFIHRDVKPSNIFLEATDYGFEPRLMDFGIAKIEAAAALTRAQEFCGTPAYTSPEQIQSTRDVDPRTDVYSMGVVLWQLLSGQEPYGDLINDPYKVLVAVVREPLPPLQRSIPEWLAAIVARATEKQPDHRFTDAAAFRAALEAGANQTEDLAQTQLVPDPTGGFVAIDPPRPADTSLSAISNDLPPLDASRSAPKRASALDSLVPLDVSQSGFPADDVATAETAPEIPRARAAVPVAEPPSVDIHALAREIEAEEGPPPERRPPVEPIRMAAPARRVLPTPGSDRRAPAASAPASKRGVLVAAGAALVVVASAAVALLSLLSRPQGPPAGFVRIEPGTFTMGSPADELGRDADESAHEVTLTRAFAMMQTEVTRSEWIELMVTQPSAFPECGDTCPVADVSWIDAIDFANRYSIAQGVTPCYTVTGQGRDRTVSWPDGLDCAGYRLPTEAEWEYAARSGSTTALPNGELRYLERGLIDPRLHEVGHYGANSHASYRGAADCSSWSADHTRCGIQPVRQKRPNGHGLFDMHGNVAEWVWGYYGAYPEGAVTDPIGLDWGTQRVARGGSWTDTAAACRSAARDALAPIGRRHVGFRLVRTLRN